MKPEILYHGSPNRNIVVLEPREESPGHALAGKFVFATQHAEMAAMFLAPKVAPMQMSRFGGTYTLIVNGSEQAYRRADSGGAIYELPSGTFQSGPTDMPGVEWFSREPVRPRRKQVYESSLEAMHAYGVPVYSRPTIPQP